MAYESSLYFYFLERKKEVDMEGKLYLCNYNYLSTHRHISMSRQTDRSIFYQAHEPVSFLSLPGGLVGHEVCRQMQTRPQLAIFLLR